MLVLSRKETQQIVIGDDIVLTVLSVRGRTVRIGIDAPSNVTVHRKEVYDAIKKNGTHRRENKNGPDWTI